jgi:hypothetical protein
VELKQYQRENVKMGNCSVIIMSIHFGHQIVLWELTNYP